MFRGIALAGIAAALTFVPAAAADLNAHGSVEQVYATGFAPGAQATLLNPAGVGVKTRKANSLGGLLFRNVKPGTGYKVRAGGETSEPLTVLSKQSAPPSTDAYNQQIPSDGYGYLTTRDGTKLAYSVHPPSDAATALPGVEPPPVPAGPTPTLIEY